MSEAVLGLPYQPTGQLNSPSDLKESGYSRKIPERNLAQIPDLQKCRQIEVAIIFIN